MDRLFKTDGIRGNINTFLTIELAQKIGKSIKILNIKNVAIAYDTRNSNIMLKSSLISGLLNQGLNVIDLGIISTPALAYYTIKNNLLGIMITASHNLYTDNGIKIFNQGKKISLDEELLIENEIIKNDFSINEIGTYLKNDYFITEYIDYLNQFTIKTNKKIIIDCANGSLYKIAPTIYNKVTSNLIVLGNNPTGKNINLNCGATNLTNLKNAIKQNNFDLGISFDGDGDRLIIIDNNLNVYDGIKLIYIILKHFNYNKVCLTKTTNLGIINSLKKENILTYITDIGDKYIYKKMEEENILIGGEASGHIILKEFFKTGDALLNSLIILNILEKTNKNLEYLTKNIITYPEKLLNIKVKNKEIINNKIILDEIKKFEENNKDGKLILRKSGTEDLLRLYICNKDQFKLEYYINLFSNLILNLDNIYE